MKKAFYTAALCAAFWMFTFGVVPHSAQRIVGGYQNVSVQNETVAEAANFAVARQKQKEPSLRLVAIDRAESQVVAGTNYRLCLAVEAGGKTGQASAVVYHNLQNEFELSEWTTGTCGKAGQTTAMKDNAAANGSTDSDKQMAPDALIKSLYERHQADRGPFFQTKDRALVDSYFVADLADMIWKDAVDAQGEVGTIEFDPLYNSQDPQITDFVVEKPREAGGPDNIFVKVTFKNNEKADSVDYELQREEAKGWKINGIYYSDGEDLASYLRYAQDEEYRKDFDANQTFTGDYMVGTVKCSVTPTRGGFSYRVECAGRDGFKLYQIEGTETETFYVHTDEKGKLTGKFVFKNGVSSGKFIDAKGKSVSVRPVK